MAKQLYDYWFVQFDFPDENGKPYKSSGGKMVWNDKLKREIPACFRYIEVGDITQIVTGKEDANFSTQDGRYPFFSCSQEVLRCDTPKFNGNAVLIAGNGDFNVKHYHGKFNAYQRTYVILPPALYYGCVYFSALQRIESFKNKSNGSIVKFITKGDVESIGIYECNDINIYQTLNQIIHDIENNRKQIDELLNLRDTLLPVLINGQITVNYHLYAIELAFCKFKVLIYRVMKEELIKTIIQKMGRSLDYHQQSLLRDTLYECLCEAKLIFPEEANLSAEEDNNILVDAFISAKKIEGCSEKTLKYYQSSIQFLLESIRKPIFKVNTNDIRSFLASYQEGRQLSKVTIDNLRRIYSSFFSWLEDEDYITKSPVRRIHKVKTDSLIKETISDEALEILRDNCTTLRDLAMVDLLASTGMRVGELVNLNIKDVNFQERQCLVFGKGNKEREVYFNARAKIHLQQYLDTRSDDNTALFVSLKSPYSRLSINGIEVRLRKLGTTCDIGRVYPHKFRRTLATMAIDKGMPIEQVQKLLGHVKIDTTLHYAMVNQTNVKMAHRKYIG